MKTLRLLGVTALAATALVVIFGSGSASASVLKQKTPESVDTLGINTNIELTLESFTSAVYEDSFGFTAVTCTGARLNGYVDLVTPYGQPRLSLSTAQSSGCGHTVDVESYGSLEIRNIAGTTNGTLFSQYTRIRVFNTLLSQICTLNTGFGTDIGTLTAATSWGGRATVDINGLIPLEGCSASTARWTGKYEVATPWGLFVEAS